MICHSVRQVAAYELKELKDVSVRWMIFEIEF